MREIRFPADFAESDEAARCKQKKTLYGEPGCDASGHCDRGHVGRCPSRFTG